MKIKTIKVHGFRIIKDLVVNLNDNTNILVGDNGSGKSTIMEAINGAISGRIDGVGIEHTISVDDFNAEIRSCYKASNKEDISQMPVISIEVFFQDENSLAMFKGTNNSLASDCPGIRLTIEFNPEFEEEYKSRLSNGSVNKTEISDIPVEYYTVRRYYFSGNPVLQYSNPFKAYFVDGTKSGYSSYVGHYVQQSVTALLQDKDQINLRSAYEMMKNKLRGDSSLKSLDIASKDGLEKIEHQITLDVKQSRPDEWLQAITLDIDGIPYSTSGLGIQRTVQMALLVGENADKPGILLFEEPENNLSYSNMSKLVNLIEQSDGRQKFIATHSSFVANKLGLKNLIVCNNGSVSKLSDLSGDNLKYFQKLPGYNTLRVILSKYPVLVEGPTDELIFDKAYLNNYGKMPIEDGVDVIVVDSLAFKRYLDIAKIVKKKVTIITDNDGDKDKFQRRYGGYFEDKLFDFYFESDWRLKTIEPSFIAANKNNLRKLWNLLKPRSVSPDEFTESDLKELNKYMTNNKSEWAWRVFDSEDIFEFPKYINEAVKSCKIPQ